MCNIAGYIGEREAAPILIEMMKRQEGYGGGFYTGIATVDENGRLECVKKVGPTKRLLNLTDAEHLRGRVGIIHSRSGSGGDDLWAHPFVGTGGHVAYVGNGIFGAQFETPEYKASRNSILQNLADSGYNCRSRKIGAIGGYPTYANGDGAHDSDAMAQLIARYVDSGLDGAAAAIAAYLEMPSEIVGLTLCDKEPDCVIWARFNQPMLVGFADHGAYLATTRLAFPDDVREVHILPTMSGGRVYRDRIETIPFDNPICTVAPITDEIFAKAYEAAKAAIGEKPRYIGNICDLVKPFFDAADCAPEAMLAYEVAAQLTADGLIHTEVEMIDGALPTTKKPRFVLVRN